MLTHSTLSSLYPFLIFLFYFLCSCLLAPSSLQRPSHSRPDPTDPSPPCSGTMFGSVASGLQHHCSEATRFGHSHLVDAGSNELAIAAGNYILTLHTYMRCRRKFQIMNHNSQRMFFCISSSTTGPGNSSDDDQSTIVVVDIIITAVARGGVVGVVQQQEEAWRRERQQQQQPEDEPASARADMYVE